MFECVRDNSKCSVYSESCVYSTTGATHLYIICKNFELYTIVNENEKEKMRKEKVQDIFTLYRLEVFFA